MKTNTQKLTVSGLLLGVALLLPFLTGSVPQLGRMLSPMHLPVLLCGFLCGWPWGLCVGLIAPLLRSVLFGMPPLFPVAVAMACELAAYGFVTGLLYPRLGRRPAGLYGSLILAMLGGRIVWGIVTYVLLGMSGSTLTVEMFLTATVVGTLPGIALQLILVPMIVWLVERRRELDTNGNT